MTKCAFLHRVILLPTLAAIALPGWAVLGGAAESVVSDQARMRAKRTVVETRVFTMHEIGGPDGTVVREYVTPSGKVFGVSWSGPTIPDLSQLLGSYNDEYQKALRTKPGRRRVAVVRNPDLVVESSGHMRDYHGRAFLNSLLPAGVARDTVK
jgi:hypothetical protein